MVSNALAQKWMKAAFVAAAIYGTLALCVGALGYVGTHDSSQLIPLLVVAAAFFGLGYGVFRKSKITALLLLVFYVVAAYISWTRQQENGLAGPTHILLIAAAIPIVLGAIGALSYKRESELALRG